MAKAWIEEPGPEPVIEWTIKVEKDPDRAPGFYTFEISGKSLVTDAEWRESRTGYTARSGASVGAVALAQTITDAHRQDLEVKDKWTIVL